MEHTAIKSWLFLPADSERKIDKAFTSSADALILDLEDAVAPKNKALARTLAASCLQSSARTEANKLVYVRVNAFDTGMLLQDLSAVMPLKPDGIVLPKSGGGADVNRLSDILDGMEALLGTPLGHTRITVVATETPQAVLNMASYQGASPRLVGLMWGAEDLAGAMGAFSNRDVNTGAYRPVFQYARDACLLGATAAGIMPIDAAYLDVKNADGLRTEASAAAREGFVSKLAIHPLQCEVINAAFSPSEQDLAWAQAVLGALAESQDGVAMLEGKMIDKPHITQAERIVSRSKS